MGLINSDVVQALKPSDILYWHCVKHHEGCGHDHDHDHDCQHDHGHTHPPVEIGGTEVYAANGVQFRYPRSWTVQEESNEEQTTITVQSAETSYWTLSLFEGRPEPERIIKSVMAAYEELYEDLDVYESDAQVLGGPAVAMELDFVCLDLVSTASMIVFQTLKQTALVMYQGEDRELETSRPLLESITQSLMCDLD